MKRASKTFQTNQELILLPKEKEQKTNRRIYICIDIIVPSQKLYIFRFFVYLHYINWRTVLTRYEEITKISSDDSYQGYLHLHIKCCSWYKWFACGSSVIPLSNTCLYRCFEVCSICLWWFIVSVKNILVNICKISVWKQIITRQTWLLLTSLSFPFTKPFCKKHRIVSANPRCACGLLSLGKVWFTIY